MLNMNEIEFSIIIPVYNKEKYVKKCIESALSQNFDKEYEIIATDDGSFDGSGKILEEFEKSVNAGDVAKDFGKKFFAYYNKNRGVSYTRNFALNKARGRYIIFLDADDYLHPDALLSLYETNKRYMQKGGGADIIIAPFYAVRENCRDTKVYYPLKKLIKKAGDCSKTGFGDGCSRGGNGCDGGSLDKWYNIKNTDGEILRANFELCTKAYRGDFLKNGKACAECDINNLNPYSGGENHADSEAEDGGGMNVNGGGDGGGINFLDFKIAEDLPFFYETMTRAEKIIFCREPFYYYRKGHKDDFKDPGAIDEVIKAFLSADKIMQGYLSCEKFSCEKLRGVEKIYAKNCFDVLFFWAKKFKKLDKRWDFYRFSGNFLKKYGLFYRFYLKIFINNTVDILLK